MIKKLVSYEYSARESIVGLMLLSIMSFLIPSIYVYYVYMLYRVACVRVIVVALSITVRAMESVKLYCIYARMTDSHCIPYSIKLMNLGIDGYELQGICFPYEMVTMGWLKKRMEHVRLDIAGRIKCLILAE